MLFFFFFLFFLILFFLMSTKKYINPYKLIMVFGKKGSGKSTLLNRWAYEYHNKGWQIYASEPMPYAQVFDPKLMGKVEFPPRSVIIIDEISLLYDNRNFKEFPKEFSQWLRLQRHYKNILIIASQTFDCDKKIRDQADYLYLVQNRFRVFAWAKKINRAITLTDASLDGHGESRIVDNLVFDSIFFWWAGSRILTWIPRYAGLFETDRKYYQLPKMPSGAVTPAQPLPSRVKIFYRACRAPVVAGASRLRKNPTFSKITGSRAFHVISWPISALSTTSHVLWRLPGKICTKLGWHMGQR